MGNLQDILGVALFVGFIGFLCWIPRGVQSCSERPKQSLLEANRENLLRDFRSNDLEKRLSAFRQLRYDKSSWDELIRVLETDGNERLALAFCNTTTHLWGGQKLISAGIDWAQSHGFRVWRVSKGGYVRYQFRP